MTLFTVAANDRSGSTEYRVSLLKEFGSFDPELDPAKVACIWRMASKHEVLFSDLTNGDVGIFLSVFLDPRSVWVDVANERGESIGVAYLTRVILNHDANLHVATWDSVARGREAIFLRILRWFFARYRLRRMSVEIPPYQSGAIRFLRRMGFVQEGERRSAIRHKGKWMPLILLGLTLEDIAASTLVERENGRE